MKRSFILLLVVALLATMIPSFALADEAKAEPTVAFSATEQKVVLVNGGEPDEKTEWANLKVEGTVEGTQLQLVSSDTKVVSINSFREKSEIGQIDWPLNWFITIKTAGEATITATLYDKDDKVIGKPATIKVTVTKKPIEKITVKKGEESQKVKVGNPEYVDWVFDVEPADAYYVYSLDWSSEDTTIAMVDKYGNVMGKKAGTVKVYAKDPDGKAEAFVTITVEERAPEDEDAEPKLSFTTKSFTLKQGEIGYYDASLLHYLKIEGTDIDDIAWRSSDPETIEVSEYYGELYPYKAGTVTITAYSRKFPNVSAECEVTYEEKPLKSITFKGLPKTMEEGNELYIYDYVITDPSNYQYRLEWTSSDPQVAYVQGSTLYAKKAGTATITASYGDVSASFDITVTGKPVTSVKFAKKEYTATLGEYINLTEGRDFTLEPKDHGRVTYSWTSSDPEVVNEYQEAVGVGTATLTLTVQNTDGTSCSDDITVTVTGAALEDVSFAKESLEVTYYEKADEEYNTHDLDLVIKPSNANITTTWQTSDPDVAYVIDRRNNGRYPKLVATGYGECEITVTATDGTTTKTATLKVKVTKTKTSVKLVLDQTVVKGYMVRGEKNAIVLKATDKNTGAAVPVTWKTSNKKVATVSKKGVVKFKSAGKAVITATTTDGKQTATCNFTIYKLPVRQIARSNRVLTVKLGEKVKLNLKVKPAKAYNPALSFKSSDPKTVAVSKQGYVKGLKVGKAVITITAKDGSGVETSMTIKVVPSTAHNDELIDDTAETLTIDGDLAVDLGSFDDLITDDTEDDAGEITEVTIE